MKKYLLLLFVWCNLATAQNQLLDPGVIYSTGNLVNNNTSASNTTGTWQGVGSWNQGLPCWNPGGPVYCGPDPYFNNGSFNFSYGLADVHQTANIASALPQSGNGLKVTGYNFGFTAKNGNGWDDGRVDYLTAYVKLFDKNGKLLEDFSYNLNYKFNWTTFNFSQNFATPYSASALSAIRYGFIGKDNNGWAGPYGPEITNISFSLKYTVDPCFINPLYSSSCPGFAAALAKLSPVSQPLNQLITTTTSPIMAAIQDIPTTSSSSQALTKPPEQDKQTNSNNNLSLALSIISKNQSRESALGLATVQNSLSIASDSAQASLEEANSLVASNVSLKDIFNQGSTSALSQASIGTSLDSYSLNPSNFLTNKANPLNEIMEGKQQLPDSNNFAQQNGSVNKNAADNDIAGGVTVARIAVAPIGYNSYLALTLKDNIFYQPKEVYKNQQNVDNARALRLMNTSSDRLHQQMVNQQYK